jgi:hypothetical protein
LARGIHGLLKRRAPSPDIGPIASTGVFKLLALKARPPRKQVINAYAFAAWQHCIQSYCASAAFAYIDQGRG